MGSVKVFSEEFVLVMRQQIMELQGEVERLKQRVETLERKTKEA